MNFSRKLLILDKTKESMNNRRVLQNFGIPILGSAILIAGLSLLLLTPKHHPRKDLEEVVSKDYEEPAPKEEQIVAWSNSIAPRNTNTFEYVPELLKAKNQKKVADIPIEYKSSNPFDSATTTQINLYPNKDFPDSRQAYNTYSNLWENQNSLVSKIQIDPNSLTSQVYQTEAGNFRRYSENSIKFDNRSKPTGDGYVISISEDEKTRSIEYYKDGKQILNFIVNNNTQFIGIDSIGKDQEGKPYDIRFTFRTQRVQSGKVELFGSGTFDGKSLPEINGQEMQYHTTLQNYVKTFYNAFGNLKYSQ